MRIGMVTIWFERGQSYLSRTLRQAVLELGHEVYLFARTGGVYGQAMHERSGAWDMQPRFDHPTYEIAPGTLLSWARYHHLSAVIFNEEYAFDLPAACKQVGFKTIHYMDYVGQGWKPLLRHYDQLWSATWRTHDLLMSMQVRSDAHFIGWGLLPGMLGNGSAAPTHDFFHNAGWLGINCRKGTDVLLQACALLAYAGRPVRALIHAQLPWEAARQVIGAGAPLPLGVEWRHEMVPPPGLYHLGRICVQPSKLEGLGLTLVEAMAARRPLVTTDAPPMHEFVTPETGWLVPVKEWRPREDPIVFQEAHVSPEDLARTMVEALQTPPDLLEQKTQATLMRTRHLFDWEAFKGRIAEGIGRIGAT